MTTYPHQDPEQLLRKEEDFLKSLRKEKNTNVANSPHFPIKYKDGALPYQEDAYNAWIENNRMGIFAMATGTGKTVTSLNCALHEFREDGFYHLLILVPTLDLVEQWNGELQNFNFKKVIGVSSLNNSWRRELVELSQRVKRGRIVNFAIISTYDSFVNKDFQQLLPSFSDNLILIADEAHNIGGSLVKKCFKSLKVKRRIALSATPERIYDDEEAEGIGIFFNDKHPYTYSFPMSRAIKEDRLCRYYYYPKIAYLNAEEMELYSYYTKRRKIKIYICIFAARKIC